MPRRVRLAPFEEQPEEFGFVAESEDDQWKPTPGIPSEEDLVTVFVDKEFREPGDDGLREVPSDQVTFI